jgi:hypothetical protein
VTARYKDSMRATAAVAAALLLPFATAQTPEAGTPAAQAPEAPTPAQPAAAAVPAIDWFADLASARAAAAEQHQPMLLLFRCER